jgi:DNA-binding transcriptional LysR family regulator
MHGMLDWDDLRFVLAVARGGSLSGAARLLQVEHSTVGRRLASIEATLGVRLFDRTPAGHIPTGAGSTVIAHASAVEDHVLALEREVAGADQRAVGTVRISALDAFVIDFLLPNLHDLEIRHPGLSIVAAPDTRMVSLAHLEADIAIRWRAPDDPGLLAQKLADIGSCVYASKSYIARRGRPRRVSDVASHERVGLTPELAHAGEESWFVQHAPRARVAVRVGSPTAYREAIVEGLGIGVYECHSADRAGLVRLWPEPVLMEEWWMVVHADITRAARIRATVTFLLDLAKKHRNALAGRPPTATRAKSNASPVGRT